MKKLKLAMAANTLLLASSMAQAAEFSGNMSLGSDYVYRGVSQTNEEATIQGGFDLVGDSGLYAGVWTSNISFDGSIEIDVYAGFAGQFGDTLGFDVGVLHYDYPSNAGPNESSFDEVYGSLSYKDLTLGVAYSNDFFFESGTATYVYVDYSLALSNQFGLDFHYADQSIDDNATFGAPDYAEYSLGLTRSVKEVDLSLTWHDTNLSSSDCFGGAEVCESRIVFGMSKSF